MSNGSCDLAACDSCVVGMDVVKEVTCNGAEYALDEICAYAFEGGSEDWIGDIIGAAACGTAANIACSYEMVTSWQDAACAAMFGNDGCCGEAPKTNTCG